MMRREWGLVPRCALIVIALTLITVQAEHTFLGCFRDKFVPAERDLGGMLALEETKMTPSFCESVCGARHQMKYFGLQYGMECWCGNSFGKHGQLDNSQCKTPCSGDPSIMCGGENMNSVYEITTTYTKPSPHPDGRPLLGLVMIVKDEAHTLPATLLAIKPWIDVYYILDTGSTDGTQDAIRKTLGPNGEVWEEPFIDYGRSRNRALEIAQSTKNLGGPPIFSLMLSADETVHNGEGLRRFCEEHRDKIGPTEEAYYVQMDVGWRFDSARLSRSDKGWRYVGRVHEYLSGPNGRGAPTHRVPSTYIKFKVTDEERRSQREYTILKILLEETQEKPHDTRSSFYLARTYNVVKNHTASLAEFQRRVSLGGWREEVYESLYAIGWQKDALKYPWHEIQQAFLDAHAHSPERAEPLYAIASHWYREKNHALAYLFASHAASLPYPTQASLWVQADVYGWQCFFIMGMTGIEVKKEKEGARALMKALIKRPNDHAMLQQLARYRANLGSTFDEIECEVTPAKCKNRLDHGPIVHPTDQPTPPGTHNTNELLRQPPTYSADHSLPSSDATPPPTSALPIIYLIIAFLIVLNVILVLALRKNKAAAACMPQVLGNFGDKQV